MSLASARSLGVFFLAGLLLASRGALAADPALVAAAEKEGQLVVYGCDPPETPGYIKQFMEKYPKIKVSSYLAGCWQIYNRHATERGAGKPVASVFFSIDDALSKMQSEGLLEPYRSTELANFPAAARVAGVDYMLVKVLLLGMTSNTEFTKGLPAPKDWFDFANPPPEWKNKITFYDPRTSSAAFSLLAAMYQNFGPERAGQIYKGLRSAGAELAPTTPVGMSKLLSGEKPIMFYIPNNHFSGAVAKGAPLEFVVPTSGGVAINFGIAVLKDAPQPNAAKLFVDWMLNEGQSYIASRNEYALHNGMPPPHGMPSLSSVKLLPLDVPKALAQQKTLINWWQDITNIH
jgi:iron(III) transport system substrate-binding protein